MTWLLSLLLALSGVPTAAPPQPATPRPVTVVLPSHVGAPQNVARDGSGEHKAGAAGASPSDGLASPATESGASLSGIASWYDAPTIHDAAAGPPLRVGNWRGRLVTVRYGSRSVVVRLTDWCACRGKAIDLDDRAFKQLAPLSVGLLRVTITTGGPALPATDAP